MVFKFLFNTEKDKLYILENNKDKYLIEEQYLLNGNFLVFSDTPTIEVLQQEQGNKISILECENKALREELTQIQTSIDSLTSLITATLEEK